jgi:hypothetical protein
MGIVYVYLFESSCIYVEERLGGAGNRKRC